MVPIHSAELFMTIFPVGDSRGHMWRGAVVEMTGALFD